MLKKIIGKFEKKKRIITWTLMWLNQRIATINATFKFLDIYIYIYLYRLVYNKKEIRVNLYVSDVILITAYYLWVSVSSTGKVSNGCIRDLGVNPRQHQKLIGVLV